MRRFGLKGHSRASSLQCRHVLSSIASSTTTLMSVSWMTYSRRRKKTTKRGHPSHLQTSSSERCMSNLSSSQPQVSFKPKKSVALSGTPAGNTALSTVGRNGNELHYRGYNITNLAKACDFEEVAYLLIHGKL